MLVQVDDRSGETVGHALEELVGMGVRNVQLLSSHTKKGRPGMVLLLDLDGELETPVAAYLAAELGAWGYHVLAATHRHFDVTLVERRVTAVCGEQRATLTVRCKLFHQDGVLLRVEARARRCPGVAAVRAGVRRRLPARRAAHRRRAGRPPQPRRS